MINYYLEDLKKIYSKLKSNEKGLSQKDALYRLKNNGFNQLNTNTKINPLKIFLDQFKSFIIYILVFAAIFSIIAGEFIDAIIILIILFANAFIGFFQELGASKSLEALKNMTVINANVFRDKKKIKINSKYLVVGDVILLEAGDKIPADCRIIECSNLKVDESVLTGESLSVSKSNEKLSKKSQLGEQSNMLFFGTNITNGSAVAIVVKTGMETQMGNIANLIKDAKEELTPLQKRLDVFGKKLGFAIIIICVCVFLITFSKNISINGFTIESFVEFALIGISLAVAAVPTALPAVVTIALSIGVKKLLKQNALVRRLGSVETLGSCNIICTDKTGTLTQNEMTTKYAWVYDSETKIEGTGYNPKGKIHNKLNSLLYSIGLNCNNASLYKKSKKWMISGDPTEAALIVSAYKNNIKNKLKRLREIPFDSDRKLMSVVVKDKNKIYQYTKGAPNNLLDKCSHILINDNGIEKVVKLTSKYKKIINEKNDLYSKSALRVLGFSYKLIDSFSAKSEVEENDLIFVGLQAMIDPPRKDVIQAIEKTKLAGIRTIMITGDYKETAKAIASEIGITGEVMTGEELDKINDTQLIKRLQNNTNIFARVVPDHKQKIISCLQKLNHVVAMTGDGVNDAPALKKANIGVAVGSGTDVAKEASDLVLVDDSFTNIVNAIEEGRGIYENIQKSIMLLLSGNLGEVLIIFLAIMFGFNLPLTAILLLWINLITDGAPAIAYSFDPYGRNIMKKKPRPLNEAILPKSKLVLLGFLGIIGTAIALFLFYYNGGNSLNSESIMLAQTLVFNFVVLYELILSIVIRQDYDVPFFSNIGLWIAIVFSVVMQVILMYTPLSSVFKIVPLQLYHLSELFIAGIVFYLSYLLYVFTRKIFMKKIFINK
jgi:Ca2+-transporting ATPase